MITRRSLLALAPLAAASAAPPKRIKTLILTGAMDLQYHDWRVTAPFLQKFLTDTDRFDVQIVDDCTRLTKNSFKGVSLALLHYNGPRWGAKAEDALEDFLHDGHGMLGIHGISYGAFFGQEFRDGKWQSSSTGDKGWTAYADMLGMETWKPEDIGHAVRHVFNVRWIDRDHPICEGLSPAFLADDELYHKLVLKPNAHVIAVAFSDTEKKGTGRNEPMIWTVPFGKGRVVYTPLGHDIKSMSMQGFQTAIKRSAEWAATGKVKP
jgi:type 1 glutamine amidotransferase